LSRWRDIFKNLPIENIVYKYQKEYYQAIAVSGGVDGCTPFIEFILGVIAEVVSPTEQPTLSTQERVLQELRRNPRITRQELSKIVGISADGVKYHLQKLSKAGVVKRTGTTRNGVWEIIE
jgi:predicted HTH transcriptional regulator